MVEVLEFGETNENGRRFATLKVEDSAAVDLGDIVQINGRSHHITGIGMVPPKAYLMLVSVKPVSEDDEEA